MNSTGTTIHTPRMVHDRNLPDIGTQCLLQNGAGIAHQGRDVELQGDQDMRDRSIGLNMDADIAKVSSG